MLRRLSLLGCAPVAGALLFAAVLPQRQVEAGVPQRAGADADPLPSLSNTAPKKAIVAKGTTKDGPDFVPASERVTVFDNDGTLWCEPPVYVQVAFALERVKALADKHPGSKEKQPFKAVLDDDRKSHIGKLDKGLDEAAKRGWCWQVSRTTGRRCFHPGSS